MLRDDWFTAPPEDDPAASTIRDRLEETWKGLNSSPIKLIELSEASADGAETSEASPDAAETPNDSMSALSTGSVTPAKPSEARDRPAIRRMPLPFYDNDGGVFLYRVMLKIRLGGELTIHAEAFAIVDLRDPGVRPLPIVPIDNKSPPLHKFNAKHLTLERPEEEDAGRLPDEWDMSGDANLRGPDDIPGADLYLRFFCHMITGKGGPFSIITNPRDIMDVRGTGPEKMRDRRREQTLGALALLPPYKKDAEGRELATSAFEEEADPERSPDGEDAEKAADSADQRTDEAEDKGGKSGSDDDTDRIWESKRLVYYDGAVFEAKFKLYLFAPPDDRKVRDTPDAKKKPPRKGMVKMADDTPRFMIRRPVRYQEFRLSEVLSKRTSDGADGKQSQPPNDKKDADTETSEPKPLDFKWRTVVAQGRATDLFDDRKDEVKRENELDERRDQLSGASESISHDEFVERLFCKRVVEGLCVAKDANEKVGEPEQTEPLRAEGESPSTDEVGGKQGSDEPGGSPSAESEPERKHMDKKFEDSAHTEPPRAAGEGESTDEVGGEHGPDETDESTSVDSKPGRADGHEAPEPVYIVKDVHFTTRLELDTRRFDAGLKFERCVFEKGVSLRGTTIEGSLAIEKCISLEYFDLDRSRLVPAIDLDSVVLDGDLVIEGCTA